MNAAKRQVVVRPTESWALIQTYHNGRERVWLFDSEQGAEDKYRTLRQKNTA